MSDLLAANTNVEMLPATADIKFLLQEFPIQLQECPTDFTPHQLLLQQSRQILQKRHILQWKHFLMVALVMVLVMAQKVSLKVSLLMSQTLEL